MKAINYSICHFKECFPGQMRKACEILQLVPSHDISAIAFYLTKSISFPENIFAVPRVTKCHIGRCASSQAKGPNPFTKWTLNPWPAKTVEVQFGSISRTRCVLYMA